MVDLRGFANEQKIFWPTKIRLKIRTGFILLFRYKNNFPSENKSSVTSLLTYRRKIQYTNIFLTGSFD